MKRWVISDTHFYHDNIVKYCGRPKEHTEMLVENWASKVRREDVTYHLGDVHFGREEDLKAILAKVPGRKYLVRGNHDRYSDTKYLLCGFDGVFDSLVVQNVLLSHEPAFIFGNWHGNIHGHLHNIREKQPEAFGGQYGMFDDGKHVLYAPELEFYAPIELEKLVARMRPEKEKESG